MNCCLSVTPPSLMDPLYRRVQNQRKKGFGNFQTLTDFRNLCLFKKHLHYCLSKYILRRYGLLRSVPSVVQIPPVLPPPPGKGYIYLSWLWGDLGERGWDGPLKEREERGASDPRVLIQTYTPSTLAGKCSHTEQYPKALREVQRGPQHPVWRAVIPCIFA
jgi:hypothetical protein